MFEQFPPLNDVNVCAWLTQERDPLLQMAADALGRAVPQSVQFRERCLLQSQGDKGRQTYARSKAWDLAYRTTGAAFPSSWLGF